MTRAVNEMKVQISQLQLLTQEANHGTRILNELASMHSDNHSGDVYVCADTSAELPSHWYTRPKTSREPKAVFKTARRKRPGKRAECYRRSASGLRRCQ